MVASSLGPAEHPSLAPTYKPGDSGSSAASHSGPSILNTHQSSTPSRHLQDEYGRAIFLHGVNVSGLNKLPKEPCGFTHLSEGFFEHETVDFVGRPWPLEEANEHLSRLQQWGLTFIRFVVPWEALEHSGPGQYDEPYLDYLHALISMMPRYGITCFVDPHQDVWSRHTGGSGAPTWTLELVGFDIYNLKATGAAHAHNLHLEPHDPPPKVWPSGYTKLAAATMATVFWAGDTFARKRRVRRDLHQGPWGALGKKGEEVGLQEFLQQSMIGAFGYLADRLKDCEAVLGFEVMNEPHRGYIDLLSPYGFDFNTDLAIGYFPTAVQSWALGSGHSVLIDHYGPSFPVTAVTHQVLLSPPAGRTAWKKDSSCIWKEHGLWGWDAKKGDLGEPMSLRNEYFKRDPESGREVEWYRDFYWPFCQAFGERMGQSNARWNTVVGPIPNEFCPSWPAALRPRNLIYGPHWYDLQALFSKALGTMSANVQGLSRGMFLPLALYFGRKGLKKNYALQIRNIIEAGYRSVGEVPVIIGETGVPFDLNGGSAFRTGDFKWQERQMDAICSALEENLVGYNLWNYNPLNNDQWGDSWNAENFCWFSTSDVTPEKLALASKEGGADARRNVGARVLDAVERPYACKIAGIPLSSSYAALSPSRRFQLRYINPYPSSGFEPRLDQSQARCDAPPVVGEMPRSKETEIYLPRRTFGAKARDRKDLVLRVKMEKGDGEWRYDEEKQTLYILHSNVTPGFIHSVDVTLYDPPLLGVPMWLIMLGGLVPIIAGLALIAWGLWTAPEGDEWMERIPPVLEGNWGFKDLADIKFGDEL